jgi:bacterioferritin
LIDGDAPPTGWSIALSSSRRQLRQIGAIRIGQNLKEVLEADLASKCETRDYYRVTRHLRDQGDYVSMECSGLCRTGRAHQLLESQMHLLGDMASSSTAAQAQPTNATE